MVICQLIEELIEEFIDFAAVQLHLNHCRSLSDILANMVQGGGTSADSMGFSRRATGSESVKLHRGQAVNA
jgi:hypothetical protein